MYWKQKGLTINYKEMEYMVVRKRDNTKYDLHTGDFSTKQVQKFNYLDSVISNVRKFQGTIYDVNTSAA